MNGIASLLDAPANEKIEEIWNELELRCGLRGVRITPFPHFTWQVTEGYDLAGLDTALRDFSRETQPFLIRTVGVGIFSSEKPVAFISIFKDEKLMQLHSRLWEMTKNLVQKPDLFYSPDQWVPHITVAYNDLTRENIGCAMEILAFQPHDMEIYIDNIIFISQAGDETTRTGMYQLGE
jgi:2'-5' RNA ligase